MLFWKSKFIYRLKSVGDFFRSYIFTELIKSAKDTGFRAKVVPQYSTHYELGSVNKIKTHTGNDVVIKGWFITLTTVYNLPKEGTVSDISLSMAWGTEREINRYLKALSNNI